MLQDNGDRLPVCAGYLPSQQSNLPPITVTLFNNQPTNRLFKCPSDSKIFAAENTSYEWNFWLNGAPYSAPQWAAIYTNEARVIVETLFGVDADGTPIIGDAEQGIDDDSRLVGVNGCPLGCGIRGPVEPEIPLVAGVLSGEYLAVRRAFEEPVGRLVVEQCDGDWRKVGLLAGQVARTNREPVAIVLYLNV